MQGLLADMRSPGLNTEGVVELQVELKSVDSLRIGQAIHLFEDGEADHETDGLVGPHVTVVEALPEEFFVDERQHNRAEGMRPRALEPLALGIGEQERVLQHRHLGCGLPELAYLLLNRPIAHGEEHPSRREGPQGTGAYAAKDGLFTSGSMWKPNWFTIARTAAG